MTVIELKKRLLTLIEMHGLMAYVYIKSENGFSLKKLLIDDSLCVCISNMFDNIIKAKYLSDDVQIEAMENIVDNRNILYEIPQTDDFSPFNFEKVFKSVTDCYSETDIEFITGFAFRLNVNDDAVWIYQQINYPQLIKRSKNIYAILSQNAIYKPLDKDILKIESKIDLLIINNSIITNRIDILQRFFGFESFIRHEATKTIDIISEMQLVDDISKFIKFEDKKTLTNAKKLLKARSSPVLRMKKEKLFIKIRELPRYNDKIKIQNDKIIIETQNDVVEFLKMLNDSILKSELTDVEYDSSVKVELEPINKPNT